MKKSVVRLFNQFQPRHYDISLTINIEKMVFEGEVHIQGRKVGRPSQRITFHQNGLTITDASITKKLRNDEEVLNIVRINNQNSFNEVRLHTLNKIIPGEYNVVLKFNGHITQQMDGIYPCFFKHEGQDKILIATQFESHDARKAFPCIDEPEAKATFKLTLITNENLTVLSNTPIEDQSTITKNDSTLQKVIFQTTPKMSSYLVAFICGELSYHERLTKNGVKIKAYATPDNVSLTDYGLEVAVKALDFFADYFNIKYPLDKLDMVALPDFSSGAMENWGLVTYRETAMLIDQQSSNIETKQYVALVICHELSHQWFGNLVTMKWWNDLWLNESFANLMEYRAVNAIYPEWNIWQTFINQEAAQAKKRDSLTDVQPIRTEVRHPDEITTLFDGAIVYSKGGSVLYMLMNYIGEETFRTGLEKYFTKHQYNNTEAEDLWAALSNVSNKDISQFMSAWLNWPGFPLVDINWSPDSQILTLKQQRFLNNPNISDPKNSIWPVPLRPSSVIKYDLFDQKEASLDIKNEVNNIKEPLIFNDNGQSYYLPLYSNKKHFNSIMNDIKKEKISPINRQLIIDNYILFQRGGFAKTSDLLDIILSYANEKEENVWNTIAAALSEIRRLIENNTKPEENLNKLIIKLIEPLISSLGWQDRLSDNASTLRLRSLIYLMAAAAQDKNVIDEAIQKFKNFKTPKNLNPTIRQVVYFCAIRYGSEEDFQKLYKLYLSPTNTADEKEEIAASLTMTRESKLYSKLFDLIKSQEVRRQNIIQWYSWLLQNRYSRQATWEWMTENWVWLTEQLKGDKAYSYFPRIAANVFSRQHEKILYINFFNDKKNDISLSRDIELGLQDIAGRIDWRNRNENEIINWLNKYK